MQIVIDIDKDYYELIKHEVDIMDNDITSYKLIAKGTPLDEMLDKIKSDYENRLKNDMVVMLEEFDLRLSQYEDSELIRVDYLRQDIQDKIYALEMESEVSKWQTKKQ